MRKFVRIMNRDRKSKKNPSPTTDNKPKEQTAEQLISELRHKLDRGSFDSKSVTSLKRALTKFEKTNF